jgi:hypothetical protein
MQQVWQKTAWTTIWTFFHKHIWSLWTTFRTFFSQTHPVTLVVRPFQKPFCRCFQFFQETFVGHCAPGQEWTLLLDRIRWAEYKGRDRCYNFKNNIFDFSYILPMYLKIGVFCSTYCYFFAKMIIFAEIVKNRKNCDHNIDPWPLLCGWAELENCKIVNCKIGHYCTYMKWS